MRTTIEMDPKHRARLLEMAARRGEKGFSGVVAEAIDTYLASQDALMDRQKKVLKLKGSLSEDEATDLKDEVNRIRKSWR